MLDPHTSQPPTTEEIQQALAQLESFGCNSGECTILLGFKNEETRDAVYMIVQRYLATYWGYSDFPDNQ